MSSVPKRIMEIAEALPEATPICPRALLHLGSRAAVDQALSRLVREERLDRIYRGIYMRTIMTRYGPVSPRLGMALSALERLWGETIVSSEGASANLLGLTTQNMILPTFLTSGPERHLHIGGPVWLRHAPRWKLILGNRLPGMVIRALAWYPREDARENLEQVASRLSPQDREDLLAARAILPPWMADSVSAVLTHG